jgi:hypothetical protein
VVCLRSASLAERMKFSIYCSKPRNSFAQKLCRARVIAHFAAQNAQTSCRVQGVWVQITKHPPPSIQGFLH